MKKRKWLTLVVVFVILTLFCALTSTLFLSPYLGEGGVKYEIRVLHPGESIPLNGHKVTYEGNDILPGGCVTKELEIENGNATFLMECDGEEFEFRLDTKSSSLQIFKIVRLFPLFEWE